MPRFPSTSFLAALRRPALRPSCAIAGLGAIVASLAAGPAAAQSCQDFGKNLTERKDIVQKLQALGSKNKQMDPKAACSLFGNLVANGSQAMKWLEANKEWCQVPDALAENIKADHARAVDLRGKACKAAAQQAAIEKKAKESGSGLLGGDGLTGSYRMPQGAL